MSLEMTSLRTGRSVGWSRILGLILVPLTVAGVLLWGLWNPQDRLDSVTAAVVNLDEPVEVDGQLAPLGRVLAGELIAGDAEQNFTWVLTDEADAEAGLDDGRYASVVTIPENFSAAATSLSDDPTQAERATIDIAESERGRLIDTALSGIVTSTATSVLNQQLGEQFVGGVFVGMSEIGAGIGEAADGASQLASGTAELSSGTSQLASGTTELASGAGELASGTTELATGTTGLADGAGSLASGLEEAATSIPDYSESERTKIAETALAPVEAEGASDELFNSSGVPLFAGIALWAGALAAFLLLAPLWRRTRDAARGVGAITLRSALPAVALGAVQGVLAGTILPIALGYDFAQGVRFFAVALLAGVAFSLVVQGLSALFGGLGRFVAFALLVVAFAAGIVSTAPAALAAIGDASPIGAALEGFQAIAGGGSASGTIVGLTLWGLGGLALTGLAVVRARRAR